MSISSFAAFGRRDRLGGTAGREDGVPLHPQEFLDEAANLGLVLDEKHRLGAGARFCGGRRRLPRVERLVAAGQVDLERRSVPRLAVDPDRASALLDDAVRGREAQPGSLAAFLGGEERLEEPGLEGRVHADAGVRDREHDVGPGMDRGVAAGELLVERHVAGLEREAPSARHGVARVDDEVDDRLLDLAGVGQRPPEPGIECRRQLDVLADDAAQHLFHARDHGVQVEDAGLEHLAPAEKASSWWVRPAARRRRPSGSPRRSPCARRPRAVARAGGRCSRRSRSAGC